MSATTSVLCRDCDSVSEVHVERCANCGSPRLVEHPELLSLAIAHLDCDAFYAAVEKRDRPELLDKPLIIGGATRGVVSTACYIARIKGVTSAMPMFKARRLCPDAIVMKPDMAKYKIVSKQIRALMEEVTPTIEPISIDEAFLDLAGTERLHHAPPAVSLSRLVRRIEDEVGVTVSIGLSHNKFLAKIASDLDKPRGFAVIGRAEALDFLARQPVDLLWGVGKSFRAKLARDGIRTVAQLQQADRLQLVERYGKMGAHIYDLAHARDPRSVKTERKAKSLSAERTFARDIADVNLLEAKLWHVCEEVAGRLKRQNLAGRTVTLKLRTADFRLKTRSRTLDAPIGHAAPMFEAARPLLANEADGTFYRLLGVGLSHLAAPTSSDEPDLFAAASSPAKKIAAEEALDLVRAKFGRDVIRKGQAR